MLIELVDPNKLLDTKSNLDTPQASAVYHTHYNMTPFEKYNINAVNVEIRTEKYFDDKDHSLMQQCCFQKEITFEKGSYNNETPKRVFKISKRCRDTDCQQAYPSCGDVSF